MNEPKILKTSGGEWNSPNGAAHVHDLHATVLHLLGLNHEQRPTDSTVVTFVSRMSPEP